MILASISWRLKSIVRITGTPYQHVGADDNDVPSWKTFVSKDRHLVISALSISERWFIGIVTATQTNKVTTQKGVRSMIIPVSRRYRAYAL